MYSELHHHRLSTLILQGNKLAAEELIKRNTKTHRSFNPILARCPFKTTLFQQIVKENLTDIAIYFIEHKIEVNTQDKSGNTPLHEAAINGNEILVDHLLKSGADPSFQNNDGNTPWMFAECNSHKKLAARLYVEHFTNSLSNSSSEMENQDGSLDLSQGSFEQNNRFSFFHNLPREMENKIPRQENLKKL